MNGLTQKSIVASVALVFFLSPCAPAQQVSAANTSPNHPAVLAEINCRGSLGGDTPLTADSEQSLPLQIVAGLKCGDQVTVVSDSTGYTVLVRTSDGKSGYVARGSLVFLAPPPRSISQDDSESDAADSKSSILPAVSASIEAPAVKTHGDASAPQGPLLRWQQGGPGSDEFLRDGRVVKSLAFHGVTVQVSLRDTGWEFRADLTVVNAGPQRFDLLPSLFSLNQRRAITDAGKRLNPITLRATTIMPGTTAYGAVWFARDLKSNPARVRIPVGAAIFEFPFTLPH